MTEVRMVAMQLAIDPELLERALDIGGEKTAEATVTRALEEYIERRVQARILESRSKFDDWEPDRDHKEGRHHPGHKLGIAD